MAILCAQAERPACAQATTAAAGQQTPNIPAETGSRVPGQTATATPAPPSAAAPTGLWERPNLLGDIGGLRPFLGNYGITLGLNETSEVLGNATGGLHRGADYDGLTLMGLGLDTQKAFGLVGGTFNITAFQIHGRNLSAENLDTLQTASGIEASRSTRIFELWYQQAFLGGKIDVKLGQQSLDQEFLISQGSSLFINTAMGWPVLPSVDLYAGGPAYPLSSLGVRLRALPTDTITILAGVFDDNPPGGSFANDSQTRGAEQAGAEFNTGTGALFITEIQYTLNPQQSGSPPPGSPPPPPPGLPGIYKLGAYVDTGDFPDQRFDTSGVSLASPYSTGTPRMIRGNFAVYGVMDQTIWRPDPQGARALGIFARIMGGPGQQNGLDFSLNTGITLKAPLPGRDNDTVGLGYGLARISGAASALDEDRIALTGVSAPVRSSESFIELTYQAQIVPWWVVQPDLQYVFMPSGGLPDPIESGQRVGNELVLGMRTVITF